jgi:hypothetical protein
LIDGAALPPQMNSDGSSSSSSSMGRSKAGVAAAAAKLVRQRAPIAFALANFRLEQWGVLG